MLISHSETETRTDASELLVRGARAHHDARAFRRRQLIVARTAHVDRRDVVRTEVGAADRDLEAAPRARLARGRDARDRREGVRRCRDGPRQRSGALWPACAR